MRHGTIAVLAAALLAGTLGCEQEPKDPRMAVDQDPPFRSEADLLAADTTTGDDTTNDEIALDYIGTDEEAIDAAASEGATPRTRTYVVRRGDKGFMDIARKQLGNVHRWREVRDLNPGVDTRKLRIGQEIVIPGE